MKVILVVLILFRMGLRFSVAVGAKQGIKSLVALLVGISLPPFSSAASIQVDHKRGVIELIGKIDRDTPIQLASAIKKTINANNKLPMLFLDSEGGDLAAAIEAGRLVRENNFAVMIRGEASCASACALLYLGGVYRASLGGYGLHRPYSNRYSDSDADARKTFNLVNELVRSYLRDMNISQNLLDTMNSVSPDKVLWLTKSERSGLGVDGIDPIFEDRVNSQAARDRGVSKSEFYARKQRSNVLCQPRFSDNSSFDDNKAAAVEAMECDQAVMEGKIR